jgi:hypothetical protein
MNLKPSSGQNIKGIGGRRSTMGTAVVPVPFPNLKLILDVEFAIIPGDDTPSLLSLRDMRQNSLGLDISTGEAYFGKRRQKLHWRNDFWVHLWKPGDVDMSLFTESELQKLQRAFV